MTFSKNEKLMIGEGSNQILHFLRELQLKIPSGIKNFPGCVFSLKKFKSDIETTSKSTGIEL